MKIFVFIVAVHSGINISRLPLARYIVACLVVITLTYFLVHSGYVLMYLDYSDEINPFMNYCVRGDADLLKMIEPYFKGLNRYRWERGDSYKTLRSKYEFCLDAKKDPKNLSDVIEISVHPNNEDILHSVIVSLLNVALARQNRSVSYTLKVVKSKLDSYRERLTCKLSLSVVDKWGTYHF